MYPRTCECGLSYVRGDPEDEARHNEMHVEYAPGPELPEIELRPVIGAVRSYDVVCVDRNTELPVRKKLAYIAYVAQRSTPDFPAGYDGTLSDTGDQRLYVVRNGPRGIGMALVASTDRCWSLRWTPENKACLRSREENCELRPVIERLWLAAEYRRRGLARLLLDVISNDLARPLSDFGWQLPFTPRGAALVRLILPREWFGDGDAFALEPILSDMNLCAED